MEIREFLSPHRRTLLRSSFARNCNRVRGEMKQKKTVSRARAFTTSTSSLPLPTPNGATKLENCIVFRACVESAFTRTNIYIASTVLFINDSFFRIRTVCVCVYVPLESYIKKKSERGRNWGFHVAKICPFCILTADNEMWINQTMYARAWARGMSGKRGELLYVPN